MVSAREALTRLREGNLRFASSMGGSDAEALVKQTVRANIRASVNHLRHGSQVLASN